MEISDLLTPDRVLLDVRVRDKAQLITEIARHFARSATDLEPEVIERALAVRERLGSTGLGAGFALPHARIESLGRYLGIFVRLAKPMDFDAIDGKPVAQVFSLLIPAEVSSHVAALAAVTRRFRDPDFRGRLAKAKTADAAYGFLTDS